MNLSDTRIVRLGSSEIGVAIDVDVEGRGNLKIQGGIPGIVVFNMKTGQEFFRGTWTEIRKFASALLIVTDIAEYG